MRVGVDGNLPLEMLDFKHNWCEWGTLEKTKNIQIHEKAFRISRNVTFIRTDKK